MPYAARRTGETPEQCQETSDPTIAASLTERDTSVTMSSGKPTVQLGSDGKEACIGDKIEMIDEIVTKFIDIDPSIRLRIRLKQIQ